MTCLAVWQTCACARQPQITQLAVTPTEVCPNDPVEVTWAASGEDVQLRQDPPMSLPDPGLGANTGVQGLFGERDFDVVLEARGRGEVTKRRYVHVVTEAWTFTLTGPTECRDDVVSTRVNFRLLDARFDTRMQVLDIVPRSDRAVTIEHGGLPPITLPPDTAKTFKGLPLSGVWALSSKLKSGESCGTGEGARPPAPAVIVSGTCSGLPRLVQRGPLSTSSAPRCGHLGQPCCEAARCASQYRCDFDLRTCQDPDRPAAITAGERCNQAPATRLSRTYNVAIRDANKCGHLLPQLADSPEEANACARATIVGPSSVLDTPPTRFSFCKNRRTQLFVTAFSADDAGACVRGHWPKARLEPGMCAP